MGETRVDLLHLLEDLRDAYPGAAEETIVAEIVANSLDSGAAVIAIIVDPSQATVTIADDGGGMRRRELARYHDVAATTKARGSSIGFAGVGIKLALLVCDEVLTETRRGRHDVATTWGLTSRHRAPWEWVTPPGLVREHGTAVRLRPSNLLSPLLDAGFIEATLRRHFQPLLDPALAEILAPQYPRGVRFALNGAPLPPQSWSEGAAPISIRLGRKRRPAAAGYLVRANGPLGEEHAGLAISTFGKVIKRGWEWLGIAPSAPDHIGGVIEVPALAECLTLNKADFIRAGARGATYLAYRKAIQEAVSRQLAEWGDSPPMERARRSARPLERDLEVVLLDLADDFPLLAALVERRAGGQRRLGAAARPGAIDQSATPLLAATAAAPADESLHGLESPSPDDPAEPAVPSRAGEPPLPRVEITGRARSARPARYGLGLQFESRPDDPELGRLVESTVWINEAHPAYRRATASRSEGYHIALAVALALAPLAVDPAKEHAFITTFLASWGGAVDRRRSRPR
jgi:hypothetical protein